MTEKGQRNHFNVKLLRGYGVSINIKDNHLILKNGQNNQIMRYFTLTVTNFAYMKRVETRNKLIKCKKKYK